MLRQAERRNRAWITSGHMRLECGKFSPLHFKSECFDKVLLVNVVYFFDCEGRDMSEVHRVLRTGGRVAIYATDRSSMQKWPFADCHTHRLFGEDELRRLCETGGFSASRIEVARATLALGIKGMVAVAQK
jgi:SAM-dependent methyltransferase